MCASIPAEIIVKTNSPTEYEVTVHDDSGETIHVVTVDPAYVHQLVGDKVPVETLIHRSFVFLLERESKESILRRFDLRQISRYFPEYETDIAR